MNKILLATTLLCTSLAQADDTSPVSIAPVASAAPATSTTRFADRCTDFTRNGWAFKSPRNFLQWLDVFSDPGIWLEFAHRGLDPQSYVRTLTSILDPGTAKNYLEWGDPGIYAKWAKAAGEPDYYTAVNAILFDPGRAMRWAMLPLDERPWKLLGEAVNPETWGKWLAAPLQPDTQELLRKVLDPETVSNWAKALANPASYPALKPVATPAVYSHPDTPRGNPYLRESGTTWRRAI